MEDLTIAVEPVWLTPNKINPQSKFYQSQLHSNDPDNLQAYNICESNCSGDRWWINTKIRMENKTEDQKLLDRELVENVGNLLMVNGILRKQNFEAIKYLINRGAQPDHWIPIFEHGKDYHYQRWNALELCLKSEISDQLMQYLIPMFPCYQTKWHSLLRLSFYNNYTIAWKWLLNKRISENPLLDFLLSSRSCRSSKSDANVINTKANKMIQLEYIAANYNFSSVVKNDFKLLRQYNEFRNSIVIENLPILFMFCSQHKEPNFLKTCFGRSYEIVEPITWRYKLKNHNVWLAETLKNSGLNGHIKIERNQYGIKIICDGVDSLIPPCQYLADFLNAKLDITVSIELNLNDILGFGGESIVLRRKIGQDVKFYAFKLIPYDEIKDESKDIIKRAQRRCKTNWATTAEAAETSNTLILSNSPTVQEASKIIRPDHVDLENLKLLDKSGEYECCSIKHKNVIDYKNVTMDLICGNVFGFVAVMPVYDCNLWQYFKNHAVKNESVDMSIRFGLFANILTGLMHIQKEGFNHLDIKPSNILIKKNATGQWDGVNCVITDFGIGGGTDKNSSLAGTPGFASPEQLIGMATKFSDNYSFGRLMVILFAKWRTAWNLLFKPVTDVNLATLEIEPVELEVYSIIGNILQDEPDARMGLSLVDEFMANIKTQLCQRPPFNWNILNNFQDVSEKTQSSVFLQKEIEVTTSMMTTGKKISSDLVTSFVHDQADTSLCTSIAVTSSLRSGCKSYLKANGVNPIMVKIDLDDLQGAFSFTKMLTIFTGCVSLRSMDGLIQNSKNDSKYYDNQPQFIKGAIDRLVHQTVFHKSGWRRIQPVIELFTKYGVDTTKIELVSAPVYHPYFKPNRRDMSFTEAVQAGHAVIGAIFCNLISSDTNNNPHAVLIHGIVHNQFRIKNSYYHRKEIYISIDLPVYSIFQQNPQQFRSNHLHLSDDDYITGRSGYFLQFKDKRV